MASTSESKGERSAEVEWEKDKEEVYGETFSRPQNDIRAEKSDDLNKWHIKWGQERRKGSERK